MMPIPKPKKPKEQSPVERLAVDARDHPRIDTAFLKSPTVRLACSDGQAERNGTLDKPVSDASPTTPIVRLAHKKHGQGDNCLLGLNGVEQIPRDSWPALLISYYYLEGFLERQERYAYRDWVMDSGAFSAFNSGSEIDIDAYIDKCKELLSTDPTLTEIYALDVIGDWKGSQKNTEYMWSKGIEAIPTFHYGEPWNVLTGLARDYPKVAIGGCVGKRDKEQFAAQCFARVWPKRMHGFNFASEVSVLSLPWHSVDSTDWEIKPCKFGQWRSFGKGGKTVYMNWRGSTQNLRCEVEWYLELERKARIKWKDEMKVLETCH